MQPPTSLPSFFDIHTLNYRISTNIACQLGRGHYGYVFKGQLYDGNEPWKTVAVKIPRVSKLSKNAANDLKNAYKALVSEARIMSYVGTHPNIVSLIGVLTHSSIFKVNLNVCIEYCSLLSLNKYLIGTKFYNENFSNPLPTSSNILGEDSGYTSPYLTSSRTSSNRQNTLFAKTKI